MTQLMVGGDDQLAVGDGDEEMPPGRGSTYTSAEPGPRWHVSHGILLASNVSNILDELSNKAKMAALASGPGLPHLFAG